MVTLRATTLLNELKSKIGVLSTPQEDVVLFVAKAIFTLEGGIRFEPLLVSKAQQFIGENASIPPNIILGTGAGTLAVFDLIHEYGHTLIGPATADEFETREHERRAWDAGWDAVVAAVPTIQAQQTSFETRRDVCLRSYPSHSCAVGRQARKRERERR